MKKQPAASAKAAKKQTKPSRRKAAVSPPPSPLPLALSTPAPLFDRVAAILDAARGNIVRAVNSNMVLANWLIGREIVQELQGGEDRAEYGKMLIRELSRQLAAHYGRGYSVTNLRYFRQFYLVYVERTPDIHQTPSGELMLTPRTEMTTPAVLDAMLHSATTPDSTRGFSATLSWSHYQELMKVEHRSERLFYEIEAGQENWDVRHLRRQIHTFLFARLLKSRNKAGVLDLVRQGQTVTRPIDTVKDPYILDFLELPDSEALHETALEAAIMQNLQNFLLELGKGFAFVARQKRIDFGGEFFYIDLVFYHCILKCYVLIDLKIGKLTHQDVGQMDSYVRMFDDLCLTPGDNPTVGLILCEESSETIARYSVLKESQQLFATKYRLHLPTEAELVAELNREIHCFEERALRGKLEREGDVR